MGAVTIRDGATLAPGAGTGVLHVTGQLALAPGATYLVELNGTAAGIEYDQTNVIGAVRLDAATLTLSLGFAPAPGTLFTIIDNDGSDPINGIFAGLVEGAAFRVGGYDFSMSYRGGSGNDVTLVSIIPEPTTWLLVIVGAVLLGRHLHRWR
jgi:hypothetical protein